MSNRRGQPPQGPTCSAGTAPPTTQPPPPPPPHSQSQASVNHLGFQQRLAYPHNQVSVSASNSHVYSQYQANAPPPMQAQSMTNQRHYYQGQQVQQRQAHQVGGSRGMPPGNPRGGTPNGTSSHGPPQQTIQHQAAYIPQQQSPVFMMLQPSPSFMNRGQSPQHFGFPPGVASIHSMQNANQGPQSVIYHPGPYAPYPTGYAAYPPPTAAMMQNQLAMNPGAAPPPNASGAPLPGNQGQVPGNGAGQQQQPPQHAHVGAQQPRPHPPQTPPNMGYGGPNQGFPNSGGGHHSMQVPMPYQMQPGMPMYQGSHHNPASVGSVKRERKTLLITDPLTGENVLDSVIKDKQKDEAAKSEANEVAKKEEASSGSAEAKDPSTSVPSSVSMKVRDEFQSKVSRVAAESKAEAVKAAAEAAVVPKSEPAAAVAEGIHSDAAAEAATPTDSSNSLRNNNHEGAKPDDPPSEGAAKSVAASSGQEEVVEKVGEEPEPKDIVHSDQKPVFTQSVKKSGGGNDPSTPEKKPGDAKVEGLEPISPTPLPETTPKGSGTKRVLSEDAGNGAIAAPAAAQKPGKDEPAAEHVEHSRPVTEGPVGSDTDVFTKESSGPKRASKPAGRSGKTEVEGGSVSSSSTSSLTAEIVPPAVSKQQEDVSAKGENEMPPPPPPPTTAPAIDNGVADSLSATPSAKAEPGEPFEELENGTPSTPGSQVKLKYTYKGDQWSPINMEGKKQYDRDFLIQLQRDPMSLTKPQNLPHMDIIKDKAITSKISPASQPDFMPTFVKNTLSRGSGGSMSKNRSRDVKRPAGPSVSTPRQMVPGLQERHVLLRTTENAWKPDSQKGTKKSEAEEAPTDTLADVRKSALAILNKLTPQKFDILVDQFNSIVVDTSSKLELCIDLIFEKAVDEPGFCVEYAKMCRQLSLKHVIEDGKEINFRKLLLSRCQQEFECDYMEGFSMEKYQEDLKKAQTEEEKKELKEVFKHKEMLARRRSTGNTRLIGELYKLGMLTLRIMHECIQRLIKQSPDEQALECLCRLVTTIGMPLEQDTATRLKEGGGQDVNSLNVYFKQLEVIIASKETSSRVRFLLQDLLDLRKRNWVPRRDVAGPKTIDQIHKDIEEEKKSQQLADLAQFSGGGGGGGGPSRSLGGKDSYRERNQDRKRSSRNNMNDDPGGWNLSRHKSYTQDAKTYLSTNLETKKEGELFLGRQQAAMSWGKGSGGIRTSQSQRENPSVMSSNRYGLLTNSERSESPSDRPRGSYRSNMSGRGASSENERESTVQAVKNLGKMTASNGPSGKSGSNTRVGQHADTPAAVGAGPSDYDISIYQESALLKQAMAGGEEKLERRLKNAVLEYCSSANVKNAVVEVKESCTPENMSFCVETWINTIMEKGKPGQRAELGKLLIALIREKLLRRSQVLEGIGNILSVSADLIYDFPKFWEWIGELTVPLLKSDFFTMGMLRPTAERISESVGDESETVGDEAGLYLQAVLKQLSDEVGQTKVAEMWKESNLHMEQFISPRLADDFICKHQLQFIQSAPAPSLKKNCRPASLEELQATLEKMLAADAPFETFGPVKFIESYLDGTEPNNAFIRMLTTAVSRNSLIISNQANQDPSQQSIQCKFCESKFEKNALILKRFLDGNVQLQVQALFAIQALMVELQHPSKILSTFFHEMNQRDIISEEAFEQWLKCEDPAEQDGKGAAVGSTAQFFTWLRENNDSGDGTEE